MTVFTDVVKDSKGVESSFLGPAYPYYDNIRLPNQIGVNSRGTLQQLGNNIQGLTSYVEVLVSGNSRASATRGPLGNRFFLITGGKCRDIRTKKLVDRSIYVNNIPLGNVPFISGGINVNFANFRGLIPGTLENLNVLNPFNILSAFMVGSEPECQKIRMETVDINNNRRFAEQYVTTVDIRNMNPCNFPSQRVRVRNGRRYRNVNQRRNPVSGRICREAFQTNNKNNLEEKLDSDSDSESESEENMKDIKMPDDLLAKIYFTSLALIGIFIFYKIMLKSKK